jgi:hypothetical protein
MKENKIIKKENGYIVLPNYDEIARVKKIVDDALTHADVTAADALNVLCFLAIEIAYNAKIGKPHFLSRLSGWWEQLDSEVKSPSL